MLDHPRHAHLRYRPAISLLPSFFGGLLTFVSPWALSAALLTGLFPRKFWFAASLALVVGVLRGTVLHPQIGHFPTGPQRVTGRVAMTPDLDAKFQRFLLDVGGRRLLVYAPPDRRIMAGDSVKVTGTVTPIVEAEGRFGRWQRRGVGYQVYVVWDGSIEVLSPGGGLVAVGSEWRSDTYERLRRHLPAEQSGLVMGMIAGQQGLVDERV